MERLSTKEKQFVSEYLQNGGNATQAALRAYDATYGSAAVIGHRRLRTAKIQAAIDDELRKSGIDERVVSQTIGDVMDSGNRPAQLQAVRLWLKVMGIPI